MKDTLDPLRSIGTNRTVTREVMPNENDRPSGAFETDCSRAEDEKKYPEWAQPFQEMPLAGIMPDVDQTRCVESSVPPSGAGQADAAADHPRGSYK